jgi:LuxR family maltose regulon positive regulatory protein
VAGRHPTERSVAWLSLEESDSQPASYWTYLITALQAVVPGVGASALQLLQSAQAHLVVSTREDPALPLARLRAGGELVEVRAADLRFTLEEAAAYLNDVAGLDLAASDIATLEGRTEGWIAALQLAALTMQGRDDVAGFIAGFAGDDRHIVDYLVEEVLGRQPADVRSFLIETSVLDRLSGPLCDAVTG